jgi:hypothetical protein
LIHVLAPRPEPGICRVDPIRTAGPEGGFDLIGHGDERDGGQVLDLGELLEGTFVTAEPQLEHA